MVDKKKFEYFEHTADVGMRVFGGDLKELFENAASGMFEILCDGTYFDAEALRKIEIHAEDSNELLHEWLSELLYLFTCEKFFAKEFEVKTLEEKRLEADIRGSRLENFKGLKREIKAVTYHWLEVVKEAKGYTAKVIFDV